MSTFRIPRRCEIGVGLLLELLKPPHKNSCLVKWKSVHAVSMISNKITWTDDHINGLLTFLGFVP